MAEEPASYWGGKVIEEDKRTSDDDRLLQYYSTLFASRRLAVQARIRGRVMEAGSISEAGAFVQKEFVVIQNLAASFKTRLHSTSGDEARQSNMGEGKRLALHIAWRELDTLLHFIEMSYEKLLDSAMAVSFKTCSRVSERISYERESLSGKIKQRCNARLAQVLLAPFDIFLAGEAYGISHGSILFIKRYVPELQIFIDACAADLVSVATFLIRVNLNTEAAVQYIVDNIATAVRGLTAEAHAHELHEWVKMAGQVILLPAISFVNGMSLKDRVAHWLQAELSFICSTQENSCEAGERERIKVNMSVQQLGLFLKLLVDAQVIIHGNHKELFRIIAQTFQTPKSINISPESLGSKFYATENSAAYMVRKYLMNMLALVETRLEAE